MSVHSTGLELILNAAEGALQIVVTNDEAVLCAQEWRRTERATEILAPALQEICAALALRLRDFRRIACVRGPGSFTGIRLVLATAAALRRTSRAQAAGLDYMQALATSAVLERQLLYNTRLWALTHARRNLVHCQPFVAYGPQIPAQPLQAVELCPPAAALQRIAEQAKTTCEMPVYVCGSGLARNAAVFAALGPDWRRDAAQTIRPMAGLTSPSVAALCLLARHGDYFPEDLEPLYVRPCDAAENLPHLAMRQGLDSDQAVAALDGLLKRAPQSEI